MKKLFHVCLFQELMVYAEDIEDAEFLFTQNIDDDGGALNRLFVKEADYISEEWSDSIPYGDGVRDRTCSEIVYGKLKKVNQ